MQILEPTLCQYILFSMPFTLNGFGFEYTWEGYVSGDAGRPRPLRQCDTTEMHGVLVPRTGQFYGVVRSIKISYHERWVVSLMIKWTLPAGASSGAW
jgi:hypothetical protein